MAASDATMTPDEPSQIWLALAAVMMPSSIRIFSFAMPSIEAS